MIEKNRSFELSKKFFDILESKLKKLSPPLNGYYNVFNNFREQGLQMILFGSNDVDDDLCIWSCMCRNSSQIMVVIADRTCSNNNSLFDEKAYESAKYFFDGEYEKATEYTLNVIKKYFPKYLNNVSGFNFKCSRCMSDLERILLDADDLDYEDYGVLATLEESNYFCDLVIMNGKSGLRYSRYLDDNHVGIENIRFEEFSPNLKSNISLMLEMNQKLTQFVDSELCYNKSVDAGDIKI